MLKLRLVLPAALAAMLVSHSVADASVLGPDAGRCTAGSGPAMLVRILGLKNREGNVRARTYEGNTPSRWFNKKYTLKRTEVPVPANGSVEICMPVAQPGAYVVDVRHDTNSDGKSDRADGAGASGNPEMSLFSFLLGRKPPASKVVVQVGAGVTTIAVQMKYLSGGSFKSVQATGN
jgi:uncharacterized protein (DUF2141 family)